MAFSPADPRLAPRASAVPMAGEPRHGAARHHRVNAESAAPTCRPYRTRGRSRVVPAPPRWPRGDLRAPVIERMFPDMDRSSELESMRRSIAMLNPRAAALDREEAMALLAELQEVGRRLGALRSGLRRLLEDEGTP